MRKHLLRWVLLVVGLLSAAAPAAAQETSERPVTADEVNAISQKLYCPVCENITLDTCGTAACADWRAEVRDMLASGMDEEAIVADFVRRFGDRVVGTPQDPVLRALSLATPWLVIGAAFVGGLAMYLGWVRRRGTVPAAPAASPERAPTDRYRDLLEQDLTG